MKKIYIFLLIALIGTMFLACQSDDDNDGGSIYKPLLDTYWYFTDYLYVQGSDSSYYELYSYDEMTDYYTSANIINFQASTFIRYSTSRINGDHCTIEYDDSFFTVIDDVEDTTGLEPLSYKFRIDGDILYVIEYPPIYDNRDYVEIYHAYTEEFPPVTWTQEEIPEDDFEVNDNFNRATLIEPGDTLFVLTLTESDEDYFRFYLEEGKTYKIQGRTIDNNLEHTLYYGDESFICNDIGIPAPDWDPDNPDKGIVFRCNDSRDYFCRVRNTYSSCLYYYFFVEETDLEAPELEQ